MQIYRRLHSPNKHLLVLLRFVDKTFFTLNVKSTQQNHVVGPFSAHGNYVRCLQSSRSQKNMSGVGFVGFGKLLHTDKPTKDFKDVRCYTYSGVKEVKSSSGAGSVDCCYKQSSQRALTYAESRDALK